MAKVFIIGTGPGSKDYFLPLAKKRIREADIVIGSARLLALFPKKKKVIALKGNYSGILEYIKKNKHKEKIAVLVSGSPGIFSFSQKITSILSPADYEIVPGISVLQLACAKVGEPWDNLQILSVHGKSLMPLKNCLAAKRNVFVFCDEKNNPFHAAGYLAGRGMNNRKVIVFCNLSLPDEQIVKTDLTSLVEDKREWPGLCLVLIKKR